MGPLERPLFRERCPHPISKIQIECAIMWRHLWKTTAMLRGGIPSRHKSCDKTIFWKLEKAAAVSGICSSGKVAGKIVPNCEIPEKKNLATPPPPQISEFAVDTLPAPRPLPSWRPPRGLFNKNRSHRPPAPRLPLPPPRAEKNKKYPKRPPRQ